MKNILIVITLLMMVGCSNAQRQYAVQSGMIIAESSVLKNSYANVEQLIRTLQDEDQVFSEQEWMKLRQIDASMDMLILKYDAIVQFNDSTISLSDVEFVYRLTVDTYTNGREIIYAHWDELQPSSQILLKAFDNQATQTSERITALLLLTSVYQSS